MSVARCVSHRPGEKGGKLTLTVIVEDECVRGNLDGFETMPDFMKA